MSNCNMFRVLPSGYESMCCNFCPGCHARKNNICPYNYCMPVAVCANCKANSAEFKRLKKKDAHESCRKASIAYHERLDRREAMKEKGVICSAIRDSNDNTVVVATTLDLYYRIEEGAYDSARNSYEDGTIDGMRARGVKITNATQEDFRKAICS